MIRLLPIAMLLVSCEITEPDEIGVGYGHTWNDRGHLADPSWAWQQGDADSVNVWAAWQIGDRARHQETLVARREAADRMAVVFEREDSELEALQARVVELEKELEIEKAREPKLAPMPPSREGEDGIPIWWILGAGAGAVGAREGIGRLVRRPAEEA